MYDNRVTEDDEYSTFKTEEKGAQVLKVTSIGYDFTTLPLRLTTKLVLQNLTLKESLNELTAVVITADAFAASFFKLATVVICSLDIVTVASSNGHVTGTLIGYLIEYFQVRISVFFLVAVG